MALKTRKFDPAAYLDDSEALAEYMADALEPGDVACIADAIGVIARTRGMSTIARETGLSRESLYRALSPEGNPELSTLIKVLDSLGLHLTAVPNQKGSG